jgi:hypothetical protein
MKIPEKLKGNINGIMGLLLVYGWILFIIGFIFINDLPFYIFWLIRFIFFVPFYYFLMVYVNETRSLSRNEKIVGSIIWTIVFIFATFYGVTGENVPAQGPYRS